MNEVKLKMRFPRQGAQNAYNMKKYIMRYPNTSGSGISVMLRIVLQRTCVLSEIERIFIFNNTRSVLNKCLIEGEYRA